MDSRIQKQRLHFQGTAKHSLGEGELPHLFSHSTTGVQERSHAWLCLQEAKVSEPRLAKLARPCECHGLFEQLGSLYRYHVRYQGNGPVPGGPFLSPLNGALRRVGEIVNECFTAGEMTKDSVPLRPTGKMGRLEEW